MRSACEQCNGTEPKFKLALTKRFSVLFLVFGSLSLVTGCDAEFFHKRPDVYVCSPSGFGQQAHCAQKV